MWKHITGFERYRVNEYSDILDTAKNKLLKDDINSAGYVRVILQNDSKKYKRFFRHRLVAMMFIPNIKNLQEVNHIDGNKRNNYVCNLGWCSRQENERAARRTGIKEYKPFIVKLKDGRVEKYEFAIELALKLNVSKRTVQNYLHKKSNSYLKNFIEEINYL